MIQFTVCLIEERSIWQVALHFLFSLYCIKNLNIYIFGKRQAKTLGILTVAGSALSSGVGTAGSVLASTAKVVGGLKTLALLGIGTSELNFWYFHFLIYYFIFFSMLPCPSLRRDRSGFFCCFWNCLATLPKNQVTK